MQLRLPKIMKVFLMRSWGLLIMGIFSPKWPSIVTKWGFWGLGCKQLSCWPRVSQENPQTTQAVDKTSCFLKTDSMAPLLRITPIDPIEHREFHLVPTWRLCSHILVLLMQRVLCSYQKGNLHSNQVIKHWPII